jgi:hypothetical protein
MPKTPEQIQQEQTELLERDKARAAANGSGVVEAQLPAAPDKRSERQKALDSVAPIYFVGRPCRFNGKDGKHQTTDDDATMPPGPYILYYLATIIAWKLWVNGDKQPPTVIPGKMYDPDYVDVPRDALGHQDQTEWPTSPFDGRPRDPVQREVLIVLEDAATHELYTWRAANATSLRAVSNLLRTCDYTYERDGTHWPLLMLEAGGYNDKKHGNAWVHTPTLKVVGRVPREGAATAKQLADASKVADFEDSIPF